LTLVGDAHDDRAIVITGICGRLGRRLTRVLHRQARVIGLDRRPFPDRPRDIEHHEIDLRSKRAKDIFRGGGVRALVHLGVMHNPRDSAEEHHSWNVVAFQHLLEYAERYKVPKVVLLSSANVYGPRPDNPQFLSEEAPLLGAGPFSDIRDLVGLDMCAQSYLWRYANTEAVILRPSHILGTVKNAPSNYLRLKVVPTLLGFDPMMQVVHQDDVVWALRAALVPGARGIFNIGGPPPVSLSRALQMLGRSAVSVPHSVARVAVERLFRWRVTDFPAPELDFIRYVCMVDDARARSVLGYRPKHALLETLRAVDEERWL
jgi:UDP-glucose 4-epimerase